MNNILPVIIYDSPQDYHLAILTLEQFGFIIGMNKKELNIFTRWFVETFPSTKGIPKAEKEINDLIWRFKFKFIHKWGDEYEFVVYHKRWFDKFWSRVKWEIKND